MFSRRFTRAGQTFMPTIFAIALVALLALLTVPGVEHQRHNLTRKQCIENLALIAAAKESIVSGKGLATGAAVTMADLVKDGRVMTEPPVFPPDVKVRINPLGTLPTCVYRGETLDPLIDNRPRANLEIDTP